MKTARSTSGRKPGDPPRKPAFQQYFPSRLAWTFAKMDVDRIHHRLLVRLGTRESIIELLKYLTIVVEKSRRAADVDRAYFQGKAER